MSIPNIDFEMSLNRELRTIGATESEAEALYDLLDRAVIPEFYTRDESGIPTSWVARMRESMAHLTPRFSANRAVREYTEQHYLPAAAAGWRTARKDLSRIGLGDPSRNGLYGAHHTALRRRCDPTGRRTNPVAEVIQYEHEDA